MVYIIKSKHVPVNEIDDRYVNKDEYFECDDLISLHIQMLLDKGYETMYCCQGHLYYYSMGIGEDGSRHLYKGCGWDAPYITFNKDKAPNFNTLPKGWKIEEHEFIPDNNINIYYEDFTEDELNDIFLFNAKIIKVMKKLYAWCESLDTLN